MHRRLNITLPQETVRLIDRLVRPRSRSRFIDEAVKDYVDGVSRSQLRKKLKEGALRRADRDLRLAGEWFELEEGAWRRRPR